MEGTKVCGEDAALRYTWPGRDEAFICIGCAPRLAAIADAMGLHLQMIPLYSGGDPNRPTCSQHVRVQAETESE